MAHHRTRRWKNDRGNLMYRVYISILPKKCLSLSRHRDFLSLHKFNADQQDLSNVEAKRLSCAFKHVFKYIVTCVRRLDHMFSDAE
jgi:hypothetical protein